jgi:hypothetical protein
MLRIGGAHVTSESRTPDRASGKARTRRTEQVGREAVQQTRGEARVAGRGARRLRPCEPAGAGLMGI